MITAGYVGVAPGTTTLVIPGGPHRTQLVGPTVVPDPVPPPPITYEQYLSRDIALRRESLVMQKRGEFWSRLGVVATASITSLALVAALGAWWRTGKLKVQR